MLNTVSVVGATSRLGINLVRMLRDCGFPVWASYRDYKNIPYWWEKNELVSCFKLDFSGIYDLKEAYRHTVVWLAHITSDDSSEGEIFLNTHHFKKFLKQAPFNGVRKVIFVSSGGSVYGESSDIPVPEGHTRNPLFSYGKSKKKLEDILLNYSGLINAAIIRPGNIYEYDPFPERGKGVIRSFNGSLIHKTPFNLLGEGQAVRDFIHIDDVSSAIICAVKSSLPFIVWNVGTGTGTRIIDILDMILEKSSFKKPIFVNKDHSVSDVMENILAIDQIKEESGWMPTINIEDGIKQIALKLISLANDVHYETSQKNENNWLK